MPETELAIHGSDSLIFRDARPFSMDAGAGLAQTLSLPLPSTLAGMLRTRLGNSQGWDWTNPEFQNMARATVVQGPVLACNGEAHFAMPADALIYTDDADGKLKLMTLRPRMTEGWGCDLPESEHKLLPLLPLEVTGDGKPETDYAWWSLSHLADWLASKDGAGMSIPPKRRGLPREERIHVKIDAASGCSEEGMLFSAQFVALEQYARWDADSEAEKETRWQLWTRIHTDEPLHGLATLGGERRLAGVQPLTTWPACPQNVADALVGATHVRLYLATPAVFDNGWKPDFLGADLTGTVPGTNVVVRLKGAAVKRRESLSGWDFRRQMFGPKPVRWMVPAGSVYFFEVVDGDPAKLADLWLTALETQCDKGQPARDGFGLGVWGIW